ncbi:hypothetical protein ABZ532_21965 [Streptomyces sp. NPDC019396]|uniref:hypothetical protein n=1 Tax=Streptomyces sp. NPDC019396 TaxID=3154687 RepID=UPI003402F4C6
MRAATLGLVTGMTLGFAGYFGGFGAFLVVAGLGALGLVVGCFVQGDLVVGDFVRRREDGQSPRTESLHPQSDASRQHVRRPSGPSEPPRSRVL